MPGIDHGFIARMEGGQKLVGYVPAASTSKSGVTVATGFDIGSRSASDLMRLGLSTALITKLSKYCGKQSSAAVTFLKANPLTITQGEADQIDQAVKRDSEIALAKAYDAAVASTPGAVRFAALPPEAQTVIASVSFQYGSLPKRTPKFWGLVTNRQWKAAVDELRNFGDAYTSRRKAEADLLWRVVANGGGAPVVVPTKPSTQPSKPAAISGSVGAGGKNESTDVTLVQILLNGKITGPGAPKAMASLTRLKVDGMIGARTVDAIKQFQKSVVGMSNPDGRVDPGGATWKALVGGGAPTVSAPHPVSSSPSLSAATTYGVTPTSSHSTTASATTSSSGAGSGANTSAGSGSSAPSAAAVPSVSGATLIARNGRRVPHYSQGDSRWGAQTLGSKATISAKGCAITSVSMILSYYGRDVTPLIMDGYLDKNKGYSGDSVLWDVAFKCGEVKNGVKFTARKVVSSGFKEVLDKRIAENKPTLTRVDYGSDTDTNYNHFVVIVGKTSDGCYVMNDPATKNGNGAADPTGDNVIERTTRKKGYRIVALDIVDAVG